MEETVRFDDGPEFIVVSSNTARSRYLTHAKDGSVMETLVDAPFFATNEFEPDVNFRLNTLRRGGNFQYHLTLSSRVDHATRSLLSGFFEDFALQERREKIEKIKSQFPKCIIAQNAGLFLKSGSNILFKIDLKKGLYPLFPNTSINDSSQPFSAELAYSYVSNSTQRRGPSPYVTQEYFHQINIVAGLHFASSNFG